MRVTLIAALLALSLLGTAGADSARKATNIPAQDLRSALNELARDRDLHVVYRSEIVGQIESHGISGELTTEEALGRLLSGTGLTFRYLNDNTVTIVPLSTASARSQLTSSELADAAASEREEGSTGNRLHLAQSVSASESTTKSAAEQASSSAGAGAIEEIVVTAQKRSEKMLEVPFAISVLGGERLEALRVNSLADIAGYIPGMSIQSGGSLGQRTIVMRGLSTGYSQAVTATLVATYIDDAPVGSGNRGAMFGLDLMPYDLDRVEVLKGPQGTLYGTSAMGGIVKYSLRKPDLGKFDARVGADLESIDGAGDTGWAGRGSVNIPLVADKLGLRLSAFRRQTPGYIDNVGTGVKDSSDARQTGSRATLLWQASEKLSVQASLLTQDIKADDQVGVIFSNTTGKPLYGEDSRFTYFPEPFDQRSQFASLDINWDLGFATLTSSSSWSRVNWERTEELSDAFGVFTPGHPDALAFYRYGSKGKNYVEEARLASQGSGRWQWMLGGLYAESHGDELGTIPTFTRDYVPLSQDFNIYHYSNTDVYTEWGVFGNATYKVNDRLDVSGGLRYTENKAEHCVHYAEGVFGPGFPVRCTERPYQDVPVQWMANARYHVSPQTVVYARAATGYRPGGGCTGCGNAALELPDFYFPDEITNYEAGIKGELLDRRLMLDLSAFYIDWADIQLQGRTSQGLVYTGNGGSASSRGLELVTSYALTEGLRLSATLAYTDAKLTEDALVEGGRKGDQLPVSPEWTGSLTADYSRPLADNKVLIAGAGYRYRDRIDNQFASSPYPYSIDAQNIVDLHAGLVMNQLTLRLYGRNVLADRSYAGLLYVFIPDRPMFVPVQPRTVGFSLDYQF